MTRKDRVCYLLLMIAGTYMMRARPWSHDLQLDCLNWLYDTSYMGTFRSIDCLGTPRPTVSVRAGVGGAIGLGDIVFSLMLEPRARKIE